MRTPALFSKACCAHVFIWVPILLCVFPFVWLHVSARVPRWDCLLNLLSVKPCFKRYIACHRLHRLAFFRVNCFGEDSHWHSPSWISTLTDFKSFHLAYIPNGCLPNIIACHPPLDTIITIIQNWLFLVHCQAINSFFALFSLCVCVIHTVYVCVCFYPDVAWQCVFLHLIICLLFDHRHCFFNFLFSSPPSIFFGTFKVTYKHTRLHGETLRVVCLSRASSFICAVCYHVYLKFIFLHSSILFWLCITKFCSFTVGLLLLSCHFSLSSLPVARLVLHYKKSKIVSNWWWSWWLWQRFDPIIIIQFCCAPAQSFFLPIFFSPFLCALTSKCSQLPERNRKGRTRRRTLAPIAISNDILQPSPTQTKNFSLSLSLSISIDSRWSRVSTTAFCFSHLLHTPKLQQLFDLVLIYLPFFR